MADFGNGGPLCQPADWAGTVGFPLTAPDSQIIDEGGADVPAGEISQIIVRGPHVCRGYWQLQEKMPEELRDDEFFLTSDMEDYVQIVGQATDLIISGGPNIYPNEFGAGVERRAWRA